MGAVFDASEVLWPLVRMIASPDVPIPVVRASREYAALSRAQALGSSDDDTTTSATRFVLRGASVWAAGGPAEDGMDEDGMDEDDAAVTYEFCSLSAMFVWLGDAYREAAERCPARYAEPAACVSACLRRVSASVAEDEAADLGDRLAGCRL